MHLRTRARLRTALVAVAAVAALSACEIPDPRPGDLRVDPYADHLPAGYTAPPTAVTDDVPYGPHPRHRFDLHRPPAAVSDPLPVLVYLHSGAWRSGDKAAVPEMVRRQVTARPVALVSANYRLAGTEPFPAAAQDVDRLVRHLRANASALGLDPSRIVIAGGSAGGHLALLAAVAPGRYVDPTLPPDLAAVPPSVSGVAALAAPSELHALAAAHPLGAYGVTAFAACPDGVVGTCNPDLLNEMSPVNHLAGTRPPPAYLAYGVEDTLVAPSTQGRPLYRRWLSARGEQGLSPWLQGVWYDEVGGAGHNLDHTSVNVRYFELWLAYTLAGRWA